MPADAREAGSAGDENAVAASVIADLQPPHRPGGDR